MRAVRAELARLITKAIGSRTANSVKIQHGIRFDRKDLYELREGNLENWADHRLWLLAEKLGVRFDVRVYLPAIDNAPDAKRDALASQGA